MFIIPFSVHVIGKQAPHVFDPGAVKKPVGWPAASV
jgi:hypothetical protein